MYELIVFVGCVFFFFFQAEDGIRDYKVTGVQTCALPISFGCRVPLAAFFTHRTVRSLAAFIRAAVPAPASLIVPMQPSGARAPLFFFQIGRASCRERV